MRLHRSAVVAGSIVVCAVTIHCGEAVAPEVVASLSVSPDSVSLFRGDAFQATAVPRRADGPPTVSRPVVWSSADTSVATVDSSGVITVHAQGFTTVTARADTVTGSIAVHSFGALRYVSIAHNPVLQIGDSEAPGFWVWGDTGNLGQRVSHPGFAIAWAIGDTQVAAVSAAGMVKGRTSGVTTVSVEVEGIQATAPVHVYSTVSSIVFGPETLTVAAGTVVAGLPVLRDSLGDVLPPQKAHWTSTNPAVVSVDSVGGISARTIGTALITATAGVVHDTFPVVVRNVAFHSVSTGGWWGGESCGIATDSAAFCWGSALGIGEDPASFDSATGPVALAGGLRFKELVAAQGPSGCGLTGDGTAYCWGFNGGGRLGHPGAPSTAHAPLAVTTGLKFAAISMSFYSVCALTSAGDTYCWGAGIQTPYHVAGVPPLLTISAGALHACGIAADSSAYCWDMSGCEFVGKLGAGDSVCHHIYDASIPPVAGGIKWISVAAGFISTCGVAAEGAAYCWGTSFPGYGSLGTDSVSESFAPVAVRGGLSFTSVAGGNDWVGNDHFCGIEQGGAAACWGSGTSGDLGNGADTVAVLPVTVLGGYAFQSLSVNDRNTCGLTITGVAYCWGDNGLGQLGDGTAITRNVPTRVLGQP